MGQWQNKGSSVSEVPRTLSTTNSRWNNFPTNAAHIHMYVQTSPKPRSVHVQSIARQKAMMMIYEQHTEDLAGPPLTMHIYILLPQAQTIRSYLQRIRLENPCAVNGRVGLRDGMGTHPALMFPCFWNALSVCIQHRYELSQTQQLSRKQPSSSYTRRHQNFYSL
jgi:hypothetical protein